MVGFVLVSHSKKLAEGVKELGLMMAPDVPVEAVGGLPDGGFGTDYNAVRDAIIKMYSEVTGGVAIFADMGSSRMVVEMVMEEQKNYLPSIFLLNCPFVEGSITAIISASAGDNIEKIISDTGQI